MGIALIVGGLVFANWYLVLTDNYAQNLPHSPEAGRVTPVYDHGSVAYLTSDEHLKLLALQIGAPLTMFLGAGLVGASKRAKRR